MFRLKPANLEVVLCFWSLFCLVLFSLSNMHLNRSKFWALHRQRLGNNVISPNVFKKTGDFDDKCMYRNKLKTRKKHAILLLLLSHRLDSARLRSQLGVVFKS